MASRIVMNAEINATAIIPSAANAMAMNRRIEIPPSANQARRCTQCDLTCSGDRQRQCADCPLPLWTEGRLKLGAERMNIAAASATAMTQPITIIHVRLLRLEPD